MARFLALILIGVLAVAALGNPVRNSADVPTIASRAFRVIRERDVRADCVGKNAHGFKCPLPMPTRDELGCLDDACYHTDEAHAKATYLCANYARGFIGENPFPNPEDVQARGEELKQHYYGCMNELLGVGWDSFSPP